MLAVDQLKAFLTMGFSFAKVVDSLSDGFQIADLLVVLDAAKQVPGGLAAAPAALAQYLAMTDEEATELEAWVVATFDVKNDAVEQAIETGLKVVIELHALVALLFPKS
jgi:hypothetical protein